MDRISIGGSISSARSPTLRLSGSASSESSFHLLPDTKYVGNSETGPMQNSSISMRPPSPGVDPLQVRRNISIRVMEKQL